jgi:hypothetical protein
VNASAVVDHNGNQRWRERRQSFRPAGEAFIPADFEIAEVTEAVARAFVEQHHYSASYPAARFRFGLARHGELVGVAVYSHPCNDAVITNTFPMLTPTEGTELGRLVLLDEVPGNAESFFVSRCHEQLAGRVSGVVSHSDPMERVCADGTVVMPGHVGTIYQALNARYLNRTKARYLAILPDGTVLSERSITKVKTAARGYRPVVAQLVALGAAPLPDICSAEERGVWISTWVSKLTRRMKHPGNHRYAWTLDKRIRKAAAAHWNKTFGALAYPRKAAA